MTTTPEAIGTFREGIRVAVQSAIDDLGGLVQRRHRAGANETHTQIMIGIGRRLAMLPMPRHPDTPTRDTSWTPPLTDGIPDHRLAAAAQALLDADRDISEMQLIDQGVPDDAIEDMIPRLVLAQIPEAMQATYVYRARICLAAGLLP